jgi:hypothetical protein
MALENLNHIGRVNKRENLISILALLILPFIIYFFFYKWRTGAIYGDDLFVFKSYSETHGLAGKLNQPLLYNKYRPMHGFSIYLLIETFKKNVEGYYFFNVLIQVINTILFALTVNLFFRRLFLSLIFSLIVGLSSFALFNMTQLFNGGALEGLAMSFFLAALYFVLKTLYTSVTLREKITSLVWAIIFANLSMYTHERYVVMLAFILFVICFSPVLGDIKVKYRIGFAFLTLFSIVLNILIKKYIYGMSFLVGTASTEMKFSFSTALTFLGDALLSLVRINSGPEYLIGVKFSGLPLMNRVLIGIVVVVLLVLIIRYAIKIAKEYNSRKEQGIVNFYNYLFLAILLGVILLPAISTIRLEQRWLQAPFSVLCVMFAIALNDFFKNSGPGLKYGSVLFITASLVLSEYTYLQKGTNNLYLHYSEKIAESFKNAVSNGVIRPGVDRLYIWEKQIDENTNNGINWSIGKGYIFDFYQGKSKDIRFVDSVYQRAKIVADTSFFHFNNQKDQLVYINTSENNTIVDLTKSYLEDTLRSFSALNSETKTLGRITYNQNYLKITNKDTDRFLIGGLHGNENGASWTNGNVSIGFLADFFVQDSLTLLLNTYMPPPCKNIVPHASVIDNKGIAIDPIKTQRHGDRFEYKFYFNTATFVQKLRIVSDTIKATPPDQRVLSFPFISLEVTKQ